MTTSNVNIMISVSSIELLSACLYPRPKVNLEVKWIEYFVQTTAVEAKGSLRVFCYCTKTFGNYKLKTLSWVGEIRLFARKQTKARTDQLNL
jgi:hypothetical protein